MKMLIGLIQKVVGVIIILVIVVAFFGGFDDTVSKLTGGSMDDNRTTTVTINGNQTDNVKETEPTEVTTTPAGIKSVITEDTASIEETEDSTELEMLQVAETNEFADGVSDIYRNVSGMIDTDSVITDYHNKGYSYVWLESHEVKAPDKGKAGDYGTTDKVTLKATYIDEDGLYYFTKEIIALYVYWGDGLGWANNYELGTLLECDASGFNDTYWKIIDRGEEAEDQYNDVTSFLDDAELKLVPSQDEARDSECYLTFYNFEQLQPSNDVNHPDYVEMKNGSHVENATVLLVINGNVYSKPLEIQYKMGSSYPSRLYNDSSKANAKFEFAVGKYSTQTVYYVAGSTTESDLIGTFGDGGSETFITPVTKEEYLSVKEKAVEIKDIKPVKSGNSYMEESTEEEYYVENETEGTDISEYILPESDSRYYIESELSGYTKAELRLARNEIYARHGRIFDSQDLNEYFHSQSWYNGYLKADEFDDSVLNDYEKANLLLIKAVEDSK